MTEFLANNVLNLSAERTSKNPVTQAVYPNRNTPCSSHNGRHLWKQLTQTHTSHFKVAVIPGNCIVLKHLYTIFILLLELQRKMYKICTSNVQGIQAATV